MLATPCAQSLHSPGSHRRSSLYGDVLSSIKTKLRSTAAAYNLTMGYRTSSQYRTVVLEPRLKMGRSVRYPNEIPAHTRLGMRDVR
ncbi:hypothetical protein TNCV_115061 [Trichonephila clavipes]|nr:hypothetical protein TNCV_115061 [Trichonephila clavipes]